MPLVEFRHVALTEALHHPRRGVWLVTTHQEVDMVGHEHERVNPAALQQRGVGEERQVAPPVTV
jgi:hypothetical protein